MRGTFGRLVWDVVALLISLWGGFFSLGLSLKGIADGAGRYWPDAAFLGLILLAVSISLGAMVHLLARLAAGQNKE